MGPRPGLRAAGRGLAAGMAAWTRLDRPLATVAPVTAAQVTGRVVDARQHCEFSAPRRRCRSLLIWAPTWGWIIAANVLLGINQG